MQKNKSNIVKIVFLFILLFLLPMTVNAHMWEVHDDIDHSALNLAEMSFSADESYYIDLIKGREIIFDGCNAGADALVAGYFKTNTRKDYQQAHKKLSLESCWQYAYTDDLKVCCLGIGAHQTQDPYSHGYGTLVTGYTQECINSFWGTNFLTHVACENSYLEWLLNSKTEYEREQLTLEAGNAYDIYFNEDQTIEGNKYARLICASIGFLTKQQYDSGVETEQCSNLYNAISTVGYFIKSGQGSGYLDMYKANSQIPTEYYALLFGLIIFGLIVMFVSWKIGINNFKWVLFVIGFLILVLGIWLGISIFTGQAFNWFRNFSAFMPAIIYGSLLAFSILSIIVSLSFKGAWKWITIILFGIVSIFSLYVLFTTNFGYVTIPDPESYYNGAVQATVNFLKSGQVQNVDASGLDYCTGGTCYTGTLWIAGNRFNIIQYLFLGSVAYLLTALYFQMRKEKKK